MKVDYISDLHLDFHISVHLFSWEAKTFGFLSSLLPEEKGDILVIAGDLSHYNRQSFFILKFFSSVYEQDSKKRATDLLERVKALSNVRCLSYFEKFEYRGVTFAGATSWYSLQTEKERNFFSNSLNDSRLIKGFDIATTHKVEMQAFEKLEPVDVLITHVPPTRIDSHDFFGSTDCFLNSLPSSAAKVFIFGHSHEQEIYEKDDTIYCINALGYPNEKLQQAIQSIFIC